MAYSKQLHGRQSSSKTAQKRRPTSVTQNHRQSSTGHTRQRQRENLKQSASARKSSAQSGRRSSSNLRQADAPEKKTRRGYAHNQSIHKGRGDNRRKGRRRSGKKKGCLGVFLPLLAGILAIVLVVLFVRGCSKTFKEGLNPTTLTEDVLAYEQEVSYQAERYGIRDYAPILLCIMMQESKGRGNDPMQSSECIYNTRYARTANSIEEPSYSIECGVQYFADALVEADCRGLTDRSALKLAIQGYNFGHGYVSWALENYGGYSVENAEEFSKMVADELGWSSYGDPEYAQKVMNYYQNTYGE